MEAQNKHEYDNYDTLGGRDLAIIHSVLAALGYSAMYENDNGFFGGDVFEIFKMKNSPLENEIEYYNHFKEKLEAEHEGC